ncbi:MAG: SagB/ThcOx family dehydrogenase [Bacteroidales bacterium]|nr:SagB/ThcOx family dehydrogenase [Bacteroidales bacterium]
MNKITLPLIAFFMAFQTISAQPAGEIQLPQPKKSGGMPLFEALNNRHSSREFSEKELDLQTLSTLLWSAHGFNRMEDKKRTTPTSRNKQEMEVYVAMKSGLYLYNAWENKLVLKVAEDIRAATGLQDYVASAPVNLIFVANMEKVEDPASERQLMASHINTGYIAQNVYLFCASEGLVTVSRAWFDYDTLSGAMKINPLQKIILCQTVGYAAE